MNALDSRFIVKYKRQSTFAEEEEMEDGARKKMEEDTEEETGEDDDEEDDVGEDKDTEEDTDKSDNEEVKNEKINKDYDDEAEIDISEESDSDREYGQIVSAFNQELNRETKDAAATSRQRSSARGGFRERGTHELRGGLTASSSLIRKSYEQNEEIRKENTNSKSSSRKTASNEEKDFESRYERSSENVGYTRGRENNHGGTRLHTPTTFHNEDICLERKSEINKANNTKSHSCHGRGGAVFHLSEQGNSFQTCGLPICNNRFDESEIHGNRNLDAPIFKPFMSKQHSRGHTYLDNIDQDTSSSIAAGIRPQEETQGASCNYNVPANTDTFQKVVKKSNKKIKSELAKKDAKIKQLEEQLAKKDEQSKLYIEEIEMTCWQKEFLPHCFGNFEDCNVYFNGSFAVVLGKLESVKEQQLKLLKELNKLKEGLLGITPAMHSILCKEEGKQYLLSLNTHRLNGAKVFIHDKFLLVVAKNNHALKDAMDFLNGKLNCKETSTFDTEIPTEKLQSLKLSIEETFLVKISWNDKQTEIYVEGVKDDVLESIREIKSYMLDHVNHEESFSVRGLHAKLFHKFHEDKIKHCLQPVKIVNYSSTEVAIDITFKGDRKVIQQVHRNLTELQTKVTVKTWDLRSEFKKPEELMLITKGFASDKMKKKNDTLEVTRKCIVSHILPSLESFKMGTSKKAQQPDTETDDEYSDDEDGDVEEAVVEVLQHDFKSSSSAEISIATLSGSGIENMWSDLKTAIFKVCLHTQYFNQEIVNFWPKDSRHRILQKAIKSCVWIESSPNPKTKIAGFIIKGEKEQVEIVYKTISEELSGFSLHAPRHRIKSSKAPKRGTCEFLKHAAESYEVFPSYWKLNSPENNFLTKLEGVFSSHRPMKHKYLVNVDSETKEAIKKLINKTWDPNYVGLGSDAVGLSHRKIKVLDVQRIVNMNLFELYSGQRMELFKKMCSQKHICPDVRKLPRSKGRIITTENLEDFMKEELYYEVNEHYLFHGTKFPEAIASYGIDPRCSSEGGMFGKGIYTAESFTKSDQYTDSRTQRTPPGTTLYMILARVLLGNIFLCDETHPSLANRQAKKLTRPPCIHCKNDTCNCSDQELYNSVMGDGRWIFRKFVVYDRNCCYPEYLISYQRA